MQMFQTYHKNFLEYFSTQVVLTLLTLIAELAECSPIIIQNSNNPSSQKNLDVRPYDRMTVQGATFNMCGQLYRGHANAMALFSSPVFNSIVQFPARARRCALETCREKKNASSTFRLG